MHPILFHIGSFSVHTFGVMLMIAFAVGIYRATYAAVKLYPGTAGKDGRSSDGSPDVADVVDAGVWMILAGVIGARAMFVALDWQDYSGRPGTWLAIWEGGISFHGALIGGLLAMIIYTRRRRISLLKLADVLAPSAMIGYAIGRIGCFFNGCCYGRPTNLPWAVRFFDNGHWTPPSHPTQIYASLLSFVFFGVLVWLEKRRAYDGQILGWYLILASTERFIMEIWRGGVTSTIVAFGMTDVQFLCLGIIAVGTVCLALFRRRSREGQPSQLVGAATR